MDIILKPFEDILSAYYDKNERPIVPTKKQNERIAENLRRMNFRGKLVQVTAGAAALFALTVWRMPYIWPLSVGAAGVSISIGIIGVDICKVSNNLQKFSNSRFMNLTQNLVDTSTIFSLEDFGKELFEESIKGTLVTEIFFKTLTACSFFKSDA